MSGMNEIRAAMQGVADENTNISINNEDKKKESIVGNETVKQTNYHEAEKAGSTGNKGINQDQISKELDKLNEEIQHDKDSNESPKENKMKNDSPNEQEVDDQDDDTNAEDEALGNTKLHRAAMNFDLKMVENLLKTDKKIVKMSNKKFRTALHEMVLTYISLDSYDQAYFHKRFLDITEILLKKGLDVNETDFKSRTPLHYIVVHPENIDVIKVLITGKVRINYQDNLQNTALHLAVARGDMETIRVLVDAGADPNARDSTGQTPLHIAAKGKHHAPVISLLIRNSAQVDIKDRALQTPMHLAAKLGRHTNVEELLRVGAKPDLPDSSGQTPLHLAAAKDTTGRVVATLLETNVNIDLQDKIYMETPLHKTIRLKMMHNFKAIVEWRPNANIQDLLLETPLHKAVSLTDVWVWESLMKIGANAHIANHIGHNPYQKALRAKNNSALAVLRQYGIPDSLPDM